MSSELGFHIYDIFRLDRTTQTSLLSRRDGVLIAIRNNTHPKLIKIENSNIEMLFVLIKMSNLKIIIGFVCINKLNENVYNEYFNTIDSLYEKFDYSTFILFGDFNEPSANFSNVYSYFDKN